jgi:hypothetical protein
LRLIHQKGRQPQVHANLTQMFLALSVFCQLRQKSKFEQVRIAKTACCEARNVVSGTSRENGGFQGAVHKFCGQGLS